MIEPHPTVREQTSEIFQLNAGIDSVNDPAYLGKGKVVNMVNMDMNDFWPVARVGYTVFGDTANSIVNAEGAILKESGDIHVRVLGTKFQKKSGGTWTDVATGLTNIPAILVSYQCSDLTTAALATGTALATSSSRVLVVSGGAMTINTYASKILRITSGTWAGQELLITGNDLTSIFVQDTFETIPDATSVFDIRASASHVIFTNGTDIPFKYDGTTKTNLVNWIKYHSLDVNHDRLFGSREDIDYVYISNIGSDFFPKNNYIPVNQNGDVISAVARNHEELVVYKENARYRIVWADLDTFQLVTADEKIGCIARKSVAHGNNYNFFLGIGGVYSINSLDNSSVDEGIPISKDITNLILAHSLAELQAAVGWIINNRYHISIGNEVFVYHIAQSQIVRSNVWTRYSYADPIKSAYVLSGVVYLWGIQTYTTGGTSDNGTVITCTVETWDKIQKDINRTKIYHRDLINFLISSTSVQIYVWTDGNSPTLFGTYSIATSGQMRMIVNKRAKKIRYRYIFPGTNSPQMSSHETFFSYLYKNV
jgi:hypothetical protein